MLDGVLCVLHTCVVSDGYSYDFVRICVMKPEPRREGYSFLHNTNAFVTVVVIVVVEVVVVVVVVVCGALSMILSVV